MNKIAKAALVTGASLCVVGAVLFVAGYFAGGRNFTYASEHVYVSGGNTSNTSAEKGYAIMKKQQIEDFTKLTVDFEDFDLMVKTSDDDHYYMEYKVSKNGDKNPLTWKNENGELTLQESSGGKGSYYIRYDLGFLRSLTGRAQKQQVVNTVILYVPEKAQLSEAEIHLSDGDLNAEQLLSENVTAIFSDGDMVLDKGRFGNFKADFGDGDLIVKDIQCTGNMQLKSEDGDVIFQKADITGGSITLEDGDLEMKHCRLSADMKISSSDGDIFIQMENGGIAKTNIYLESSDGDVDAKNLSYGKSYSKGDTSIYENKVDGASPTLNAESEDGDITLSEAGQ